MPHLLHKIDPCTALHDLVCVVRFPARRPAQTCETVRVRSLPSHPYGPEANPGQRGKAPPGGTTEWAVSEWDRHLQQAGVDTGGSEHIEVYVLGSV